MSFRSDPPEPPVIPVVIVNKQQKESPLSSDTGVAASSATADDSANSVPAESTIASGTASDHSESEEVALEGRFGLWESLGRLSPKVLRKRFDYRRRERSLSCPVAAVNMGIARNFSL